MRLVLELVGERLQYRRLTEAAPERLREDPVGEPRIPGKQRPVQVRPDRPADPAAFVAALAVVAEPRDDAPERRGPGVELRASGMVLEPREGANDTRLELALEQNVSDHA